MSTKVNVNVPYFQANQLVTDGTGRTTPQFTISLNNVIANLQNQLTQIEQLFADITGATANINDLEQSLKDFQELIKTFQTDMVYLKGFSSYTTGLSITCDLNQTISVNQHSRHFFDGTTVVYNGTTWINQDPNTTYYIFMDTDGTYHHSTNIDDMVQSGTRYCLGRITTPTSTAKTGTVGDPSRTLGQLFL